MRKYDVFISYASEDKEEFVGPLAEELRKHGLRVWYDRFVLRLGDSLRDKIDEGLREAKYGVVVLSPAFFAKGWPKAELDALFTRQAGGNDKVLLPVWHQMSESDVRRQSPLLAGIFATRSDKGVLGVVGDILEIVCPDLGRFAKDAHGKYICQVEGGPFAGVHVLLVDAPEAPRGGPKDMLKEDVVPYVVVDGKNYCAGLVRRPKLPHLLTGQDMWSLPLPGRQPAITRHGPILEITIAYARHRFKTLQDRTDGTIMPVFTFDKEEDVVARL